MSKPLEFTAFPKALACTFGPYMAVVEQVIDGDTFYALVDPGFHLYSFVAIRIRRINAPELFSGLDRVAGALARDYLLSLMPVGAPVKLATEGDVTTFGRFVADVTLADGRDVGTAMIAAGHALPYPP